jgi:hypothetical protein
MSEPEAFKTCSLCRHCWQRLNDFVLDPALRVEGYQASFLDPKKGLILLTHQAENCDTTLAIKVEALEPLYDGPTYLERHTGGDDCGGYCLSQGKLEECLAECDMAWVRKVLQLLRRHEMPPHLQPEAVEEQ